jgi:hypothetical protein
MITLPILSMPLPDGGSVVCRVEAIIGATSNIRNEDLTDVYVEVMCPEGITIDVDIDSFTQSWLAALITPMSEMREDHGMH